MSLVLVAGLSYVVRLRLALRTKNVLAFNAPHTIQTHVYGRLVRNFVSVVVFDFEVDFTLLDLHNLATRAFAHVRVCFQKFVKFTFCYLV